MKTRQEIEEVIEKLTKDYEDVNKVLVALNNTAKARNALRLDVPHKVKVLLYENMNLSATLEGLTDALRWVIRVESKLDKVLNDWEETPNESACDTCDDSDICGIIKGNKGVH